MAYSIVAACVMLLRYEVDNPDDNYLDDRAFGIGKIFNIDNISSPTNFTSGLVTLMTTIYALLCVWVALAISLMGGKVLDGDATAIVVLSFPIVAIILTMIIIVRQPKSTKILTFSVPFTPWFPALSIIINFYLMAELDVATWIRFGVWIAFGLLIYFFYGRRYSKEKQRQLLLNSSVSDSIDKTN